MTTAAAGAPRIAYLVNQYPKVSHAFIRREIEALERLGMPVLRFAVRGWDGDVPDAADRDERARTRYLLRDGLGAALRSLARLAAASPRTVWAALCTAARLSAGGEKPLPYHLVYLAEAARLLDWVRRESVTHVHAHFGTNSAEVAWLVHALGGPPFSFTVHGPEEFDKPAALHLGRKTAAARFTVAISSFGRSQLLRWTPHGRWGDVHVVRCGVDAGFLEAPLTPVPSEPTLVCVGRICEQKGQLLLVEALAALRADGIECRLVLAGDGEMRAEVEALAARLGVADRLRITGWLSGDRVREEIVAARALVLPSFAEGLPVVLMEALALGRPVVSTYVAGIPELVVDGGNGWLVPAGDVGALAGAMRAVVSSAPERLAALGAAGRARVRERHDVDREAAVLAGLFRSHA